MILFGYQAQSQNLSQVLRGTVIDQESQMPLPGANVVILGTDPILGTSTDFDGKFKFEAVPLGRLQIEVSFIGYQSRVLNNIEVNSAREMVLKIELQESLSTLEEVTVKAKTKSGRAQNDMIQVSGRSISMEELNRFTASFNDPALVTANYAGVSNSGSGGNEIIIRGNAPKYMQWQLDGLPISNPNHFADQGAVGGSTSALNSNLLATSDFSTGAFAPEYGNALSGVYDLQIREGNNEKLEAIFGIGLIGTDLTLEGPLAKGYDGSFLVNYRYSTATLLNDLGAIDVNGDMFFQDAAFKVVLPTKKAGRFSIFGLGGYSGFALKNATPADWETPGDDVMSGNVYEDYDKQSFLFNSGINHSIKIDDKSFLKSSIGFSLDGLEDDIWQKADSNGVGIPSFDSDMQNRTYTAATSYQRKQNNRLSYRIGSRYTLFDLDYQQAMMMPGDSSLQNTIGIQEQVGALRNYLSMKYRLSDEISLVAGVHHHHILYNNKYSVEPRFSASYQHHPKGTLRFGYGMHSSMERLNHYFAKVKQADGSYAQSNTDLDLLKAHHFVLGYDWAFSSNLKLSTEVYYQHLYQLPVANDANSYYSTINEDFNIQYVDLVNKGTGRNYGLEMTLQRFLANNYYFLINASVFDSKYTTLDGRERNTRFNGNYIVNFLAGKEWTGLGSKNNQTLGINFKAFIGGGKKVIPLLRDENGNLAVNPAQGQYWDYDKAYETDLEDIYTLTISASYKWQLKRTSHELFLNLENLSNNKGKLSEYYDANQAGKVGYTTQFGLLPNLMYRIYF